MKGQMSAQIRALVNLRTAELKERYIELFGEAPSTNNRDNLLKRVAWRMQATTEGGLTERARERAEALANVADVRLKAPPERPPPERPVIPEVEALVPFKNPPKFPRPTPGTIITKDYKGRRIVVLVRADGFEWDGRVYRSLSAVANAVTGAHWSGSHFFGLGSGRTTSAPAAEVSPV